MEAITSVGKEIIKQRKMILYKDMLIMIMYNNNTL